MNFRSNWSLAMNKKSLAQSFSDQARLFCIFWRWRELNPRPKSSRDRIYKLIPAVRVTPLYPAGRSAETLAIDLRSSVIASRTTAVELSVSLIKHSTNSKRLPDMIRQRVPSGCCKAFDMLFYMFCRLHLCPLLGDLGGSPLATITQPSLSKPVTPVIA